MLEKLLVKFWIKYNPEDPADMERKAALMDEFAASGKFQYHDARRIPDTHYGVFYHFWILKRT